MRHYLQHTQQDGSLGTKCRVVSWYAIKLADVRLADLLATSARDMRAVKRYIGEILCLQVVQHGRRYSYYSQAQAVMS